MLVGTKRMVGAHQPPTTSSDMAKTHPRNRRKGVMQTKNADVYLGLLDHQNLITLLLNQADGEDGVTDILQDDIDDMEYDVHATFEYTWEGDPKATLPSSRRLVSLTITSHRD